jgi:hypothetical protein
MKSNLSHVELIYRFKSLIRGVFSSLRSSSTISDFWVVVAS